jgi:RNA polymerase primary sigma factor/RNA polymerase nonessential primary-like sigma factor
MTATHDTDTSLLSPAEVVSLQRQIEAGVLARAAREAGRRIADASDAELAMLEREGEESRQRFIRANLRLVGMVCQQFAGRGGVSQADLFQEGCIGLIVAVQRFDYARGYRFSTYALFWIRAYIGAATARQLGALNLPTSRAERLRAARGVEAELSQVLGRSPSLAEIAAALGRTESWTADLLAHQRPSSIEQLDGPVLDDLRSVQAFDAVLDDQFSVRDLLGQLDDLARGVLELRLGFIDGQPRSFAHTARVLHISVSKVRRVETRALESLRAICPQQASELL